MQQLTVLNQMLGTMGETPLNSIEDAHTLRGACLSILDTKSREIQARGWWFNTEEITLNPQLNGRISLPGDSLSVRTQDRNVVQRGQYLYALDGDAYTFTSAVQVEIIRLIPFTDLPESAAAYIAACSVLRFQVLYDADRAKTEALVVEESRTLAAIQTDETRNRYNNVLTSNTRLQRLKHLTRGARYPVTFDAQHVPGG